MWLAVVPKMKIDCFGEPKTSPHHSRWGADSDHFKLPWLASVVLACFCESCLVAVAP